MAEDNTRKQSNKNGAKLNTLSGILSTKFIGSSCHACCFLGI